jgi:leukotriene-A4 hydrolase
VKKELVLTAYFLLSLILSAMAQTDPHSFARPNEAVVTHLSLNLTVDFEKHQLRGTASIEYSSSAGAKELILDTRGLAIQTVTDDVSGKQILFQLKSAVPFLGQALIIPITTELGKVKIAYTTSSDAAALQWLNPEQTGGKRFPFLFSQSQAILARTWVPIQDSPGIRFTYDATLHVPAGLMAVMSAENPQARSKDGTYTFNMPQAIPAYLLSIAVGDFDFKALDQRSGVYAEPSLLEKSAYEFADLPKMITAAEQLYGPYAWGRYDLIILPPSFPFGGMENPRITFATPTIIAGDRSLTTLVAHELAHSWSGNLVTNETWNDFWLNEGFTVYFENRIMEALYGKDFADMQRLLGQVDLKETIDEMGPGNPDSRLKLDLAGRDPDDGVTDIAYEKGNNLLMVIENYTGRERFDAFLNMYFKNHAFKTTNTEAFLKELKSSLFSNDEAGWKKINVEEWVYKPGLPDNCPVIHSTKFDRAAEQAALWTGGATPSTSNTAGWSAFEWVHFIQQLPALNSDQLKALDRLYQFSSTGNNEILFNWMLCCIKNNDTAIYPVLEKFLNTVGRRKYVKPLFAELVKTPQGKTEATKIFASAKNNYHTITRETVMELLK